MNSLLAKPSYCVLISEPSVKEVPYQSNNSTAEAIMKIKQNRLVIILGTSDFSTSIAGQLNQSQKARGEPEVIAALVAQTNGALSQVENLSLIHI